METLLDNLSFFIVQGSNWDCRLQLDSYNSEFKLERQFEEAATRCLEQFMGQDKGLTINCNTIPEVGGVVSVFVENTNPENATLLFCHELLANAGFYKESFNIEQKTKKIIEDNVLLLNQSVEKELSPEETEDKKPIKKRTRKKPKKNP